MQNVPLDCPNSQNLLYRDEHIDSHMWKKFFWGENFYWEVYLPGDRFEPGIFFDVAEKYSSANFSNPYHVMMEDYGHFRPPYDQGYYLITSYISSTNTNFTYYDQAERNAIYDDTTYQYYYHWQDEELEYSGYDNVRSVLVGDPTDRYVGLYFNSS